MSYTETHPDLFHIAPSEGGEKGAFVVDFLAKQNQALNLVVTAAGEIVLARAVRAKTGLNRFPVNLRHFAEGEFEITLFETDRVHSGKLKI